MYDPKSSRAEEFISHQEILDTLEFADRHKGDLEMVDAILAVSYTHLTLPTT